MSLTITIPIPHKATHPNARSHWAAKAKHAKKQREDAYIAAQVAVVGRMSYPKFKSASTSAVFYFRTKHSRDIDNLTAWLKATYDGLADARIVDNDKCFVEHAARCEYDKNDPRVEITINPRPCLNGE